MAVNSKVDKVGKSNSKGIVKFIKEIKAETKRITWPTKEQVKKSTIIVLVFCAISAVLIGVLDFGFSNVYKLIFA